MRQTYLVAALMNDDMTQFLTTWFVPLAILPQLARTTETKFVIRPNTNIASKDKFVPYRCLMLELVARIIAMCEGTG